MTEQQPQTATIIRTPRPAQPDTRRMVWLDVATYQHLRRATSLSGGSSMTNGHILELKARARRANLVVAKRETPDQPQPRQDVRVLDEAGWSLPVLAVNADTGRASLDADVPRYYDYADLRVVLSW